MPQLRISIDRGGTFTDVYCYSDEPPHVRVMKLLSEDPQNYDDAPREAIRRLLGAAAGTPLPVEAIDFLRMGTTIATNALLEKKGERFALVTTRGFRDALRIGSQARPDIFDLTCGGENAHSLYADVLEVDERVLLARDDVVVDGGSSAARHTGITGEDVIVRQAPDLAAVRRGLQGLLDQGIRTLAVVFMHAYTYPAHEEQVGRLAREMGFAHVSISSETMPMARIVPRGQTTCVDAYLTPKIRQYISNFCAGFEKTPAVAFMQSDGGLTSMDHFTGSKAILSGPAGGVVGYAMTTSAQVGDQPVIGFDMGGTSTDVSRYGGKYDLVFETEISGVAIQAPQLDIQTVAAGGGSRLFYRAGMLVVGPESAGAHPGPVCYRKGGHLAVTDANLLLGRILPQHFPKIFGPTEDQPLDYEGTLAAFSALTDSMGTSMTPDEVAYGFLEVANEAMCRPIRALTEARGFDPRDHVLACFGGAGPQHACAVARSLGMRSVFVHRFSGILSAYGLGLADVVREAQEPCARRYSADALPALEKRLGEMAAAAASQLEAQGFDRADVTVEKYLHLRYDGTDTAIMAMATGDESYEAAFRAQYQREFGFTLRDRAVVVDDLRVRAIGKTTRTQCPSFEPMDGPPEPVDQASCYFKGGRQPTPVFDLAKMGLGHEVAGPAILISATFTLVVEPNCRARIVDEGILVDIGAETHSAVSTAVDSIQLSIFAHRFMGIAEQMGRTLQRTAISTNIKERLDFSCALFSADGGLVANAPHLPVHLGSMSETVRWQIKHRGSSWKDGQVVVTNHPAAGGSHLPDITVVSPIFHDGRPVFYVASRGHHADIGGISPGSMPPFSQALEEEGACIKSFVLVEDGVFQEAGITELLMAPGKVTLRRSGLQSSGTRNLRDNLSDLKAQVAANQKGIRLMGELIEQYGLEVVLAYMGHVQDAAEAAVRDMLREISVRNDLPEVGDLVARDAMDDGTPICLRLTIDRRAGSAVFDFTGTGPEVCGNCNSPAAVTTSAILYSLRSLVKQDIPLNHGCLLPIRIVLPPGTILSPSEHAAVVGGNVLTSQRVTDVILDAFGACANSQGCMNNFTFGDETSGYYETIAGGSGAGPSWDGVSGIQTHMTNTRITDPEILERRYPTVLCEFGIRAGSGGEGKHRGGNGVVREVEFRKPMTVSILSERRALAPKGLAGGENAQSGRNLWVHASDGRVTSLGGKNSVRVDAGDRVRIETPGGGGFGKRASA